MKTARRSLALALGLLLGSPLLPAQAVSALPAAATDPMATAVPTTPLRREALRLIREDVATAATPAEAAQPAASATETAGEVVTLAPFVVQEQKTPDFSTPRETPTQTFFRTGTVARHVGEKVTTQLWIRGDRGVMLSFRW